MGKQAIGQSVSHLYTYQCAMGKQAMGQSSLHIPVCYGQAGHGSVSQSPSLLRCVRRRLKLNEFGATDVGRITKQLNITAIIQSWRLSIFVHIARTDAKVILASPPPYNWKRPPGRPRITWLNTVQRDLRANNLTLNKAVDLVQNRPLWRLMSTYGATHS